MEPTVGRIVHYYPRNPEYKNRMGNTERVGEGPFAAMIIKVYDTPGSFTTMEWDPKNPFGNDPDIEPLLVEHTYDAGAVMLDIKFITYQEGDARTPKEYSPEPKPGCWTWPPRAS